MRDRAAAGAGHAPPLRVVARQRQNGAQRRASPARALDRERAPLRHRVATVDCEVQKRVFQLVSIDQHRPDPLRKTDLQPRLLAQATAQQILHAGRFGATDRQVAGQSGHVEQRLEPSLRLGRFGMATTDNATQLIPVTF